MAAARTFTDEDGRELRLRITVATLRRVRDETGVELADIYTGELAFRLLTDPAKLVAVLYVVAGVDDDPDAFARAIGHRIDVAATALLDACADFFDVLTKGAASASLAAARETLARTTELAARRATPPTDEQLESLIETALGLRTSGDGSMRPPASSASTPARTPSASCSPCTEAASASSGTRPRP